MLADGLVGNLSWLLVPVVWVGSSRYIFNAAATRLETDFWQLGLKAQS